MLRLVRRVLQHHQTASASLCAQQYQAGHVRLSGTSLSTIVRSYSSAHWQQLGHNGGSHRVALCTAPDFLAAIQQRPAPMNDTVPSCSLELSRHGCYSKIKGLVGRTNAAVNYLCGYMGKFAFVLVLRLMANHTTNPHGAPATGRHTRIGKIRGALRAVVSLQLVKSRFPTVLLADGLTDAEATLFITKNVTVLPLGPLPKGLTLPNGGLKKKALTFSKLSVWGLTQFDKVVVLDGDTVVRRNVDHLLAIPTPAAAMDPKWASAGEFLHGMKHIQRPSLLPFNSGVMVVRPDALVHAQMIELAGELWSYDLGDQGFLAAFFANKSIPVHELPRRYNLGDWCKQADEIEQAFIFHLFAGPAA
ncbi:putative Glycogenin glucosyltransferase [Emiliania huxleyi CCMP1516]|uniref:Uncharacterized protein n=2 Tax=Emiliania huxleyi TaxID=2903 RepID=A0A0D3KHP9_EMIH1|nr:putative Glycogenin glucosyltransferase [Emiliania huxleyi CCMP1516]EOD35284.1 putative Glycogenin glucosyltransferase [Emiliania huxleyi CCMP1516]|eukprot:XP_005787713.1 putative Glycogenin glucosyltransferase [Emiliania huxleyi CCMP1516]